MQIADNSELHQTLQNNSIVHTDHDSEVGLAAHVELFPLVRYNGVTGLYADCKQFTIQPNLAERVYLSRSIRFGSRFGVTYLTVSVRAL